jgi:monoamine oxidase
VWMGAMTKVVARFERAFWRDAGLAGSAMSHVGPMREIHDMSGPDGAPAALFGFVPAVAPGMPTVSTEAVTAQLRALFGPGGLEPTEVHVQDWRHERFTSPGGADTLHVYETYGHTLYREPAMGGRLHWASTETAADFPGHVEGALSAGARAAADVLALTDAPVG